MFLAHFLGWLLVEPGLHVSSLWLPRDTRASGHSALWGGCEVYGASPNVSMTIGWRLESTPNSSL